MSDGTRIEWTDATWSPVTGCTKVSEGCTHCYIERTPPFRMQGRKFRCPRCDGSGYVEDSDGNRLAFGKRGQFIPGDRCSRCSGTGRAGIGDTTGVRLHEDRLTVPLRWRKPRRVFVCSMADLFHESIPDEFIARVFAVMALAPQHTFQILTKRPARMRSLLGGWGIQKLVMDRFANDDDLYVRRALAAGGGQAWPLPNVWIGVSVEDQKSADLRIPILLDTFAAVRWLSCEPLLGPVNLTDHVDRWREEDGGECDWGHCSEAAVAVRRDYSHQDPVFACMLPVCAAHRGLDWVVVGGESGPGARPMRRDWARSLRDQCAATGVPFLFKQWGEWAPDGFGIGRLQRGRTYVGGIIHVESGELPYREIMTRVGKRNAGRELDGVLHDAYPGGAL